ncbi:hypothetical protein XMIN_3907 [Xanthomonas citri pv. mangiferaeindicae LMG 941]|nr:hypothetical protein XMIN_3907 [Xanthomonas citri pv. mangiferaeindicae LMG 941]
MRGTASYRMTAIGSSQHHNANIRLAQSSVYTRAACRTASPNAPAWRRRCGCLRSR